MNRNSWLFASSVFALAAADVALVACSSSENSTAPTGGDAGAVETGATQDSGSGSNDGGGDAGPCDDSVGNIGICAFYKNDGGGPEGGSNHCIDSRSCDNILTSLKPRIAQKAIDCLAAIPECTEDIQIQQCVIDALVEACPDDWAAKICDESIGSCTNDAGAGLGTDESFTQDVCLKWTAGMIGEWRGVLPLCLQSGNGCLDPAICVPY